MASPMARSAEPTSKLRHESFQLDLRRPKHGDDGVLSDSGTGSRSTVIRDPPRGGFVVCPSLRVIW